MTTKMLDGSLVWFI